MTVPVIRTPGISTDQAPNSRPDRAILPAAALLACCAAACLAETASPTLYICPEDKRVWMVAVGPDSQRSRGDDQPPAARIALWSAGDKRIQAWSMKERPRLAAAFRERGNDTWGLCLVLDDETGWSDGTSSYSVAAPPLAAIHSFAASEKHLYVLGDSIRQDTRDDRPGEQVLLIFDGHLWRQWPYELIDKKRMPRLLADGGGFSLLYTEGNRLVRYDCRDFAVGPRTELPAEHSPPPSATLFEINGALTAAELPLRPRTAWREIVLWRLEAGRWLPPKAIDVSLVEPDGQQDRTAVPQRNASAAFAARGGKIWVLLHDAESDRKFYFGSFAPDATAVRLEAISQLNPPEGGGPQLSTSMLLALGLMGLLMLLIWRRGARDARWLVRAAALPVAPWPRRIAAALIDLTPAVVGSFTIFRDGWLQLEREMESGIPEPGIGRWLAVGSLIGVWLLHTTISELAARATLGKWLMHLTVVDERGRPARRGQILVRNLLRVVDVMPILVLVMLVTRYRQRLGDLLARTVVAVRTTPADAAKPDRGDPDEPPDEDAPTE